jgi:hypothetical protein
MASSLKNEALVACHSALARLGYKKQRGGMLIRSLEGGVSGWIGLNLATQGLPLIVEVNPVVGVRFDALDEIMVSLRDDISKNPMPVVSKPLGYLMPEKRFRTWNFLRDGDHEEVAASLAEAVTAYGAPYIATYADWVKLVQSAASDGFLLEHERVKVLPVILMIDQKCEEARQIVETELDRVSDSDDMYAQSYRRFGERFYARFGGR